MKIKYLFIFRQHYKYEDITPARREFLEKQDENMTQKRQEADLSYWAQVILPFTGQIMTVTVVRPRYDLIFSGCSTGSGCLPSRKG